jgi:hypothetical protein
MAAEEVNGPHRILVISAGPRGGAPDLARS